MPHDRGTPIPRNVPNAGGRLECKCNWLGACTTAGGANYRMNASAGKGRMLRELPRRHVATAIIATAGAWNPARL